MRASDKYDHHLLQTLRTHAESNPDKAAEAELRVHVRYTGDIAPLKQCGLVVMGDAGGVAIGDIGEADLHKLEQLENVIQISVQPPIFLHLNTSVPEIHADVLRTGSPPYTGSGTVIGVIDDGIDIYHKNFRNPDGTTRIISIWDQTLVASGSQHPPAGYTFGVEFSGAVDVTNALANPSAPFGHVESPIGHGTHVAGIAAGNGLQADGCQGAGVLIGVAPEADLVIVRVITDANSPNKKTDVGLAAQYVLQVAAAQSPAKPVVVNMSLSSGIGPCDGTNPVDTFLDGLLQGTTGKAFVISAGNNGSLGKATDKYPELYNSGSHAAKHIVASDHTTVTLLVPPDQADTVSGEVWYSSGAGRLQFKVTGPTGVISGPVNVGSATTTVTLNVGADTVQVTSSINTINSKGQISFQMSPPAKSNIHQGSWVITLTETAGAAVDMDLWLRAAHTYAHTVIAFADRVIASTVTSPATALNVIAVGAYGSLDGILADFSSHGPTLAADNRQKPDICAPGIEKSPGAGIKAPKPFGEGHCCCDCCYDFYQDMQGTSQAAPHVAGVVALMLQKHPSLDFNQIRTAIRNTARTPTGVTGLPNSDWGYGKIDALAAMSTITAAAVVASAGPIATPGIDDSGEVSVPTSTQPRSLVPPVTTPHHPAPFPPLAEAIPASSLRIGRALQDVADRGKNSPSVQILISLISMHFDEVRKLINTNRRVAMRWHRMFGPALLRHMLWNTSPLEPTPILPAILNGQSVLERMSGLFDVLGTFGSARLRKDITSYGPLFLALPGASFSGITALPHPEIMHGAGWHA